MNKELVNKLNALKEANELSEASYLETRKTLSMTAENAKFFYEECLRQGFSVNQAFQFTVSLFCSFNNG